MNPQQIKLTVEETLQVQQFFAKLDGKAEGFALAMEQAKVDFVKFLIAQRKPADAPEKAG